jgi:hypothetical protein
MECEAIVFEVGDDNVSADAHYGWASSPRS